MGHEYLYSVSKLLAILFVGLSTAQETLADACNDNGYISGTVIVGPGAVKNLNSANTNAVQVDKECKDDNDCSLFCSIGYGCCTIGRRSNKKPYCSCAMSQDDPCPELVSANQINSAYDAGATRAVTLSVNSFTVIYDQYDIGPPFIDYDVSNGHVNIKAVVAGVAEDGKKVVSKVEVCGTGMAMRIAKEYFKQLSVDEWMEILDEDMVQRIADKFREHKRGI